MAFARKDASNRLLSCLHCRNVRAGIRLLCVSVSSFQYGKEGALRAKQKLDSFDTPIKRVAEQLERSRPITFLAGLDVGRLPNIQARQRN